MSKRTVFTTVSPLPPGVPREAVLAFLHDHEALIDLNPLVIERHPIAITTELPPNVREPVPADERENCEWWSLTDKIARVPGDVTYAAAFHDLPDGVQTHVYAPLGTDIRERWSLGGTLPGEPPVPVEIGIGAPAQGLYIREDIDLRCNFLMAPFVKKTLMKAHGTLVERLVERVRKDATATAIAGSNKYTDADTNTQSIVPGNNNGSSNNNTSSSSAQQDGRNASWQQQQQRYSSQ